MRAVAMGVDMQIVLLLPLAAVSATGRESDPPCVWPATVAGACLPPAPWESGYLRFHVRSCAASAPGALGWW